MTTYRNASQRYVFKDQTLRARHYGETDPTGTVELTVDWDAIVRAIGAKAAHNSSSKARTLNGAIKAKFIPSESP